MPLWLAAVLSVFLAAGVIALGLIARRRGKKAWIIASIIASSIVLLAVLAYIFLTFIFIDAAGNQPPHALPGTSSPSQQTSSVASVTAIPKPDNYDLPIEETLVLHPDVLGLKDDIPGQKKVSDKYFYIPLNEEYEHMAADYFDKFLQFVNKG